MKYAVQKRGRQCMAHGTADCGECMADGGMVGKEMASGYQPPPAPEADAGEEGLVDRIMARFAKGGMAEPIADFEPNDFDYMDKTDVPDDADYTAENSGDEDGNAELESEEDDVVERARKSWKKKDKNPRPA